jgi:hypothetical protein
MFFQGSTINARFVTHNDEAHGQKDCNNQFSPHISRLGVNLEGMLYMENQRVVELDPVCVLMPISKMGIDVDERRLQWWGGRIH